MMRIVEIIYKQNSWDDNRSNRVYLNDLILCQSHDSMSPSTMCPAHLHEIFRDDFESHMIYS
jgi:hypothetical protein